MSRLSDTLRSRSEDFRSQSNNKISEYRTLCSQASGLRDEANKKKRDGNFDEGDHLNILALRIDASASDVRAQAMQLAEQAAYFLKQAKDADAS
jgi:hypothetical protein